MQMVSEKISAVHTAMTVEHSEICHLFPLGAPLWLGNVEDDCNSVLVVVSYRPLVCGGRIALDNPIGLETVLGRLEVADGQ